jgi:hypothetical protein
MISNENVWDVTNQQPIGNQIKKGSGAGLDTL